MSVKGVKGVKRGRKRDEGKKVRAVSHQVLAEVSVEGIHLGEVAHHLSVRLHQKIRVKS